MKFGKLLNCSNCLFNSFNSLGDKWYNTPLFRFCQHLFLFFSEGGSDRMQAEGGMHVKIGRWPKLGISPSDTPSILLPRPLPPSLSFAANSLRSHTPLGDSMADTGLPADVQRCSEWICFPPPPAVYHKKHLNTHFCNVQALKHSFYPL